MINVKRKGQVSGSKGQVSAFAGNKKQITTTKKVVADVNAIVRTKKTTSMAAGKTRLPISGGSRTAFAEGTADTGGGISWPLVEDTDGRTYYDPVDMLTSSDGLFVLEGEPIETLSLTDGEGSSGEMQFQNTYA
ncbi:MAG: hypothetical protein GY800_13755 [Planctomycetes bacterium]|nr:hypothetical protein [Planctomycetota bacterium]